MPSLETDHARLTDYSIFHPPLAYPFQAPASSAAHVAAQQSQVTNTSNISAPPGPVYTTAGGLSPRQQTQGRMRSSIACIRCRRSKVKCVNNGVGTTCRSCENSGRECTYPSPITTGTRRRDSISGRGESFGGDGERRQKKVEVAAGVGALVFKSRSERIELVILIQKSDTCMMQSGIADCLEEEAAALVRSLHRDPASFASLKVWHRGARCYDKILMSKLLFEFLTRVNFNQLSRRP